jgi:DNA repair exonuclease SbcCD ATPase subunit
MKILSIHLENFASYKTLDFDFDNQGLALIHGANGSGKSTLCDAIPWLLFGITAKNGKVDDVISWNGGETFGTAVIDVDGRHVQISRSRKPNDLYYRWEDNTDANPTRGKDLADTQKQINVLLGMDADLYLAGAYFHEFSQTAQFFTTTAKNRRAITEQLADLSMPVTLQEKIKSRERANTIELNMISNNLFTLNARIELISESVKETSNSNAIWAYTQANKIATIEAKRDTFDSMRLGKLKTLESELAQLKYETPITYDLELKKLQATLPPESVPCVTCGTPAPNPERDKILAQINILKLEQQRNADKLKQYHYITNQINELKDQENPYIAQLAEERVQVNPHTTSLLRLEKDLDKNLKLLKTAQQSEVDLRNEKLNLELLSDMVVAFRSELVRNTIQELERRTVSQLRDHFEGEITVEFTIQDNDKLEVLIRKDGNECSYTQLSKGQRQILKLCFGVSVMECIQQHHALEFHELFFDESLDGMDDTNKLRATKMLETLAARRGTVYIVEHSEGVKAHIDNKYLVELIDGKSKICPA